MRPLLLLALLLSTSTSACDKQNPPPPGSDSGVSGGASPGTGPTAVENLPTPAAGEGGGAEGGGAEGGSAPGTACGDKTCAAGEQCISYYGVAGPAGPKFQECGIPCKQGKANDGCPEGKRCQTIADGPGPVCR